MSWPYNTEEWKELRARKLARDPNCELCPPGVVRKATAVDHKKSIRFGGAPFPPLNELWSSCWSCHSAKTARGEEHGAVKTSAPMKTIGLDGMPLDPTHSCYKK